MNDATRVDALTDPEDLSIPGPAPKSERSDAATSSGGAAADVTTPTGAPQRRHDDGARRVHLVAHGLREPMRTVSGYLDLVAENAGMLPDDETRSHLDRALEGARKLRGRIEAYVAWERAAFVEPGSSHVDLEDVFACVLEGDIGLRDEDALLREGTLPVVFGDRIALGAVLAELTGNAVAFRGDGPLVLRVRAYREGDEHVIVFEDNGRGFRDEHAERAFEPFTRLHADASGPGMGLAIARRIAERHGGSLTARSEPGRGATFVLRLPAGGGSG